MSHGTYQKVVNAAQAIDHSDSQGAFRLADAVYAHIPSPGIGGDRRSEERTRVSESLTQLVNELKRDDVVTPKGEPYTSSYLDAARNMAMRWTPDKRHPEAAFRTHQEAYNDERVKVLNALCAYACGETVRRPSVCDADAWMKAKARIDARTSGFKVTANDLRVALKRPTNNTGESREPKISDVEKVLQEHGAEAIAKSMTAEQRTELAEALEEESFQEKSKAIDRSLHYIEWLGELAKAQDRVQRAIRHHEAAIAGEGRNPESEAAGEHSRLVIQRLLEADADLSRGITDADLESLLEGGH